MFNPSGKRALTVITTAPIGYWKGVLLASMLATSSTVLAHLQVWPFTDAQGRHPLDPVLLAIVGGIALTHAVKLPLTCEPGLKLASKKVLALGIVLLGARLDLSALLRVGVAGLAGSAAVVASTFLLFRWLGPLFRLTQTDRILLAVGTAICGGTAIVAIAPLLRARDESVVVGVATMALLGLAGMAVLPVVAAVTGMSAWEFGVWTGLTIHQTPQVIAAGLAHSPEAGEIATIVKLARVCLLAPVAIALALWTKRRAGNSGTQGATHVWRLVPGFVLGFGAMAVIRTLGLLPEVDLVWSLPFGSGSFAAEFSVLHTFELAAGFLLTVGMAAVGLETRLDSVRSVGLRPLLAAASVSLILMVTSFVILRRS